MTKVCNKCTIEKSIEDFYRNKDSKDGHKNICKECCNDGHAKYVTANAEKVREQRKRHRQENLEEISAKDKQRNLKNRDQRKASYKVYYWNNREKILTSHPSSSYKDRRDRDPQFKISGNLRNRLNQAIKLDSKKGSAIRDLGCSVSELKTYLESKFHPGMNWNNYGKGPGKWNIDHIVPLSAFDLQDRQHLILACYYINLQPLWWEDNIDKGSRILLSENMKEGSL